MVGMRGMGGLTVSMWWARGVLQEAWVTSTIQSGIRASAAQTNIAFVVAAGSSAMEAAGSVMHVVSLGEEGAADVEVDGVPEVAEVAGLRGVVVKMRPGQQARLRCQEKEENCIAHDASAAAAGAREKQGQGDDWLNGWSEGGWVGGGSSDQSGAEGAAPGSIPSHKHPTCG